MESLEPGDPSEIGGYRLLARLGAGGMGEVFLARTHSGRPLALKTVHRDLSREPGFAERFAREIRTNDRVRSPWTVSVVDFSPPGAAPQWLATEYVAAPSLGDWVGRHGPLAGPVVHALARELAAALVAVRAVGVVHRDIKPGNVLLGPERPYLIDFGIARAVQDPRRTRTGTVLGTPGYLAPEQATGEVAGAPADVFSLAAVLVYAATGRGPFLADAEELSLPALLYRVVHDEPGLTGVPDALLPLVRDCLAKAPEDRPTAEEVCARLGGPAAEGTWAAAVPAPLAADAARRAQELGHLLTTPLRRAAEAPPGAPGGEGGAAPTPTAPGTPPPGPVAGGPGPAPAGGASAASDGGAPVAPGTPAPTPVPGLPTAPGSPPSDPAAPPAGTGTPAPAPTHGAPAPPPVPGIPAGTGTPSSRGRVIAAVAGAAALAVVVTLAVTSPWNGGDGDAGAKGGKSPTPSAAGPGTAASLPASWVGTWAGVGPGTPKADGLTQARTRQFEVTVTLQGGAVGEVVGRQVSNLEEIGTGRNLGCTEALELRQVRGDTVFLLAATSHPTDSTAPFTCPQGNLYVVTLSAPDRVKLESEGAQSAGAPGTLTRKR
ncbi:serine/threonine-protein kinase [Streptomyces sp. NPDC101118]|uniref:serine/threonine-protein kinase n=1 Tax=Streptomyces sp. NPDC101118 TaxID=3366109 RepID=UPI003828BC06